MDLERQIRLAMTRRQFFGRAATGIGVAALASVLGPAARAGEAGATGTETGKLAGLPHFAAKAKRVIFLHQAGAPSTIELFDYKPRLKALNGSELPESVRNRQRLSGMASGQSAYTVTAPIYQFNRVGKSGTWISELLPHMAKVVDDIAVIKTVHTDAINHDPAITHLQTGAQQPGRPSMGAWISYGLGSENHELPAFVVLISQQNSLAPDQPLAARFWGTGFMPSKYQGVKFRAATDPVLYLSDPPGLDKTLRRRMLASLSELNHMKFAAYGDSEIETRIAQYEMAYRMQTSVPELMDLSKEPESAFELYGPDARKPGTYAANCLLARRLAERNVRFIQLYHRGWDQHVALPRDISLQCKGTDQASAALIQDLKQRGMLDETLVIWGGEFGRTIYSQSKPTVNNYGRDHHAGCYAMWMAGGGVKGGLSYGQSDDFCYNIEQDPVHIHDVQATILHCLGIDHTRLTYRFQGRDFRLTDVSGEVVHKLLA